MRLLFTLVVAALEVTAVSLPLTALTGAPVPWPLLLLAEALGWLADQVAPRLGPGRERAALAVGAAAGGLLLPVASFGSLPAALAALLPGSPGFLRAYALLLLSLFLYWRGSRLDTRDSDAVSVIFSRGVTAGLVSLVIGAIAGTGAALGSPAILAHILGLIALGLLALALAHAQDSAGGRLAGLSWRWLATLLAAIGAVVVVATLATSLLGGGGGAAAAQSLIGLALLPLALVGGLIAWLFVTFLGEPLVNLIRAVLARLQLIQIAAPPQALPDAPAPDADSAFATIQRLAEGATFLMALIPVAILVVAILLLRRRRAARAPADEERESLGLLASLGGDLRGLLAQLRNPFARRPDGLRAALAALRGDDPTARARRAYVGLLLLLEGRALPRPADQTPAEFAPAAAATAQPPEAVQILTSAYERARYNPAGVSADEAAAAEQALREVGR